MLRCTLPRPGAHAHVSLCAEPVARASSALTGGSARPFAAWEHSLQCVHSSSLCSAFQVDSRTFQTRQPKRTVRHGAPRPAGVGEGLRKSPRGPASRGGLGRVPSRRAARFGSLVHRVPAGQAFISGMTSAPRHGLEAVQHGSTATRTESEITAQGRGEDGDLRVLT